MAKELKSNFDVYFHTVTGGFLLKFSRDVIRRMMKSGKIKQMQFQLSYNVVKDKLLIKTFEILNNGN